MKASQKNLVWLRDTIEHLAGCQQQLEWTEDAESVAIITETMLRELENCRRLCESLRRQSLTSREPQFA